MQKFRMALVRKQIAQKLLLGAIRMKMKITQCKTKMRKYFAKLHSTLH